MFSDTSPTSYWMAVVIDGPEDPAFGETVSVDLPLLLGNLGGRWGWDLGDHWGQKYNFGAVGVAGDPVAGSGVVC